MVRLRGAAAVPFGRRLDPADLVRRVTDRVLEDAGLRRENIDLLVVANAAAEGLSDIGNVAVWTATHAGLAGLPALRVETGPSSGLAALAVARAFVASGRCNNALVLGWEAMTHVTTAEGTRALARLMAADERALGLTLPSLVALMASAYMAHHDVTRADLARIPERAHRLAQRNPIAQYREPITAADVLASRPIAPPIHLLDCAPMTDGAAAVVVSRQGPVEFLGMGHATDLHGYAMRRSSAEGFEATRRAAAAAFAEAGTTRRDVDVVELHDAFSVLEPIGLEDLGFAGAGTGLALIPPADDPLSSRPVPNPSGGLKARGHPVGATGVAQVVECVDQITRRAANQVEGARTALAHNIGGFGNNVHCAILGAVG